MKPALNPDWLADASFDLETNGLLDEVNAIHCAVIYDRHTDTEHRYGPGQAQEILAELTAMKAKGYVVAAHNGIKYDTAVIDKLLHTTPEYWQGWTLDTLVTARVAHPDLRNDDADAYKAYLPKSRNPAKRKAAAKRALLRGKLPAPLWGSHSLKAWGLRLGVLKGNYGEQEAAWDTFTPAMLDYCAQDVQVTLALLRHMEGLKLDARCVALEHGTAWVIAQQERNGFPFDETKARALYLRLVAEKAEVENRLIEWFPPWRVQLEDFIPKRNNKARGFTAGVPVPRFRDVLFNPASRDHIADRLKTLFGWRPTEFTETGKAKVDEETLKGLPYPPVPDLIQYLLIQKRIGQLAEGDNAWLKLVHKGKIHGTVNTGGAVTGRATHANPNIGQVPATTAAYGPECRELFTAGEWPILIGCDTSGLELRCLAHYMAPWDGGEYADTVVNGDVHTANQKAAGLAERSQAKTFISNNGDDFGETRRLKLRELGGHPTRAIPSQVP